jgi:hypothetical protein
MGAIGGFSATLGSVNRTPGGFRKPTGGSHVALGYTHYSTARGLRKPIDILNYVTKSI